MHLLDTNTCIYWMEGRSEALVRRIAAAPRDELAVPSIVAAELRFGVENSDRFEPNRIRLNAFLADLSSVPFDHSAAEYYGAIRLHLKRSGMPIGLMDMLIAATTLAHDAILVTHNTDEFSRVPRLRLEDWTIPI